MGVEENFNFLVGFDWIRLFVDSFIFYWSAEVFDYVESGWMLFRIF